MTSIDAIEKAVRNLPKDQLAEFRRWFEEFEAEQWDREIEVDAKAGRLDALAEEALKEYREGRCKEL